MAKKSFVNVRVKLPADTHAKLKSKAASEQESFLTWLVKLIVRAAK